jgi:tRNA 2-thiouridine synthesizing protein E
MGYTPVSSWLHEQLPSDLAFVLAADAATRGIGDEQRGDIAGSRLHRICCAYGSSLTHRQLEGLRPMRKLQLPAQDKEGYLVNLGDWREDVAIALAVDEGVALEPAHWQVIHLLREFYQATETSPAMRPLVTLVKEQLGAECGSSVYLMQAVWRQPGQDRGKNCWPTPAY